MQVCYYLYDWSLFFQQIRGQFTNLSPKSGRDLDLTYCNLSFYYVSSYRIEISDNFQPQIENHDGITSSRINTTWTGLIPGQTYTFTVTCQLPMTEDCEGIPPTFTASTLPCTGI